MICGHPISDLIRISVEESAYRQGRKRVPQNRCLSSETVRYADVRIFREPPIFYHIAVIHPPISFEIGGCIYMPSIQHLQKGISASMRVTNNRKSLFIKPDKKVTCSHESIIVRATSAYLGSAGRSWSPKINMDGGCFICPAIDGWVLAIWIASSKGRYNNAITFEEVRQYVRQSGNAVHRI